VHKAISSLKGVTTGTQFDGAAPSLIIKYLFGPMIQLLEFIFFRNLIVQDEITGHKFGVYEELEEQLWFTYYHSSEIPGGYFFPDLGKDSGFMKRTYKVQDIHLEFVKRCILRTLYYQGNTNKAYVGCPLSFMVDPVLFRKHFPLAKVVVCCRDPVQSVPSLFDLTATIIQDKKLDGTYTEHYKMLYKLHTLHMYKNMASWPGDEETIWLDFENWKNEGVKQLEMIWSELKWDTPVEAAQAALNKSEGHKNRPECFQIISPDQIRTDLGSTYKQV